MKPGDLVVVPADSLYSRIIAAGTLSRFSHARLVVDENGLCLEAWTGGARYAYVEPNDVVVEAPLTDGQRAGIPSIAHELYGTPYGFLDVAALGLAQLGLRLPSLARRVERPDRLFCSQLIDFAWQLAGFEAFDDGRLPQNVSPGDLADLAFRGGWRVLNARRSIPVYTL